MKIEFAKREDWEECKWLWIEAFGDEKSYIDLFYHLFVQKDNLLLYWIEGEIVGMLTLLPASLRYIDGSQTAVKYLYAVATKKSFQNRGVSTALLNAAQKFAAITCLCPATKELFSFYEKRGYSTCSWIKEKRYAQSELSVLWVNFEQAQNKKDFSLLEKEFFVHGQSSVKLQEKQSSSRLTAAAVPLKMKLKKWKITTISAIQYARFREVSLAHLSYIFWDDELLEKILLAEGVGGSFYYGISNEAGQIEAAVLGSMHETQLTVKEFLGEPEYLEEVLGALNFFYQAEKITVRLAQAFPMGESRPFVVFSMSIPPVYMGLVMD
ncbi:hypothetical protein FACS189418_7120 [Clostridia bacterium]|nr:hypothetical protein FACS189418_7120 [Clostridia bacterium]